MQLGFRLLLLDHGNNRDRRSHRVIHRGGAGRVHTVLRDLFGAQNTQATGQRSRLVQLLLIVRLSVNLALSRQRRKTTLNSQNLRVNSVRINHGAHVLNRLRGLTTAGRTQVLGNFFTVTGKTARTHHLSRRRHLNAVLGHVRLVEVRFVLAIGLRTRSFTHVFPHYSSIGVPAQTHPSRGASRHGTPSRRPSCTGRT